MLSRMQDLKQTRASAMKLRSWAQKTLTPKHEEMVEKLLEAIEKAIEEES